jgi:hypothetical protein
VEHHSEDAADWRDCGLLVATPRSGKITNNDDIGLPNPTAANFINSLFRLSPEKQEADDQTNDRISSPGRGFQRDAGCA